MSPRCEITPLEFNTSRSRHASLVTPIANAGRALELSEALFSVKALIRPAPHQIAAPWHPPTAPYHDDLAPEGRRFRPLYDDGSGSCGQPSRWSWPNSLNRALSGVRWSREYDIEAHCHVFASPTDALRLKAPPTRPDPLSTPLPKPRGTARARASVPAGCATERVILSRIEHHNPMDCLPLRVIYSGGKLDVRQDQACRRSNVTVHRARMKPDDCAVFSLPLSRPWLWLRPQYTWCLSALRCAALALRGPLRTRQPITGSHRPAMIQQIGAGRKPRWNTRLDHARGDHGDLALE